MAQSHKEILKAFFARYAAAAAGADNDVIIRAYGDSYIEATPTAVATYKVDSKYRKALEEKSGFMRDQLGLREATADLAETKPLAPNHVIADVDWTMRFEPRGKKPVTSTFRISYVVRMEEAGPRILLYVSHVDEQEAMRRDGLLPDDR